MSKYATRGLAWGTNWTIDVSDCKTSAEVNNTNINKTDYSNTYLIYLLSDMNR